MRTNDLEDVVLQSLAFKLLCQATVQGYGHFAGAIFAEAAEVPTGHKTTIFLLVYYLQS